MKIKTRLHKRKTRRVFRVRNRVRAVARPRLSVFRSNRHMYAQVIDDRTGRTLASACTVETELYGTGKNAGNIEAAGRIGALIAERAIKNGVTRVVFDRAGYKYHGRVKALAAAAREGGLDF